VNVHYKKIYIEINRHNCPYIIEDVSTYGAVELKNPDTNTMFTVNGQRLKPFNRGGIPTERVSPVLNEPLCHQASS